MRKRPDKCKAVTAEDQYLSNDEGYIKYMGKV